MKNRLLALIAAAFFTQALSAGIIIYNVSLTGPGEAPPNASPGLGTGIVTIDDILNTMRVQVQFSGLLGTTTNSHIHCCTTVPLTGAAGVATTTPTFAGFPLGVTSGTYDQTLDLTLPTSYNPAFVAANGGTTASAEAVLLAGTVAGESYLNIHTTSFPGGEIRGFLIAQPEPSTFLLGGAALVAFVIRRRRR